MAYQVTCYVGAPRFSSSILSGENHSSVGGKGRFYKGFCDLAELIFLYFARRGLGKIRNYLDNAYWAGTSAAIVCQPRLGASLSKGSFRMIGTVLGAVAIVVLTACFPQSRIGLRAISEALGRHAPYFDSGAAR
jgi:hypothetical protein